MSDEIKKVLLCTGVSSETDDNENQYKKWLEKHGLQCDILQVLHFEFVNLDELRNLLLDPESYSGLILTSPRAAAAISLSKMQYSFSMEPWIERPTFCVGRATHFVAKEQIGLANIQGSESGNAKNLARFIIDTMKNDYNKPLLLPCSDIARDTIPQMMSEENMDVKKVVVYKTQPNNSLENLVKAALGKSPNVLVFFSPSIVENMIAAVDNDKSVFEKFKNIAIGPVTEQALMSAGISVHGVSQKPDPICLTETIVAVIKD